MTPQTPPTAITLSDISKTFGQVKAVTPTDLEIAGGEFLTLLGPSGCGKTTLLRMIAGLESVSSGSIFLDTKDVTTLSPRHRDVAIMFQDYALFPHMSVLDNVAYGLKMRGVSGPERRQIALTWLERLDIAGLSKRKPAALSGGQRQRVALARALITEPGALLLDEPLSALDANLRAHLRNELRRIHREVGTTFICVTHDQEEAMTLSDRIVVLKDGKIEQIGTPNALYDHPVSAFVAEFFGRCTLLPAKMLEANTNKAQIVNADLVVPTSADCAGMSQVSLVVRPETFEICDLETADLTGRVLDVISKGPIFEVNIGLEFGPELQLDLPRHAGQTPEIGAPTGLRLASPALAAVPKQT